jgi:hypothetical protein
MVDFLAAFGGPHDLISFFVSCCLPAKALASTQFSSRGKLRDGPSSAKLVSALSNNHDKSLILIGMQV